MKKNAGTDEAVKTPASGVTETAPEQGNTGKDAENGVNEAAQKDEEPVEQEKDKGPDLVSRIAELEKINASLQDQYLRKAADFDNYRKRMIKETQEARDFANTNLLVDLVQILDNFDRAIEAGGSHEAGTPAAAFSEGIGMIRNQLGSMLETKYGLTYYPAKGLPFDPNCHEAISTVVNPEVKEPTVSEEFTKGYKLKDRVIRTAKVLVQMPVEIKNQ
jgi:molecular chaperone GrpE